MKLSLGPIQFYWDRQTIVEFYEQALTSAVDIIYLGETVCSKRHELRSTDWLELAQYLSSKSDKQIVLSTLALIESASELSTLRRLCDQDNLIVEANDMAAVYRLHTRGLPFVCGPTINIYNHKTLAKLTRLGMQRWTMPVELGRNDLHTILATYDEYNENLISKPETEVLAYGKLPLAYSARCFTARALELSKDDCGYSCLSYPDGLQLTTQEEQQLFTVNGIQVMSAHIYNLSDQISVMASIGVDVIRISPQWQVTWNVVAEFKEIISGNQKESVMIGSDIRQGYWFGQPGIS